jgi:hypothetical protein
MYSVFMEKGIHIFSLFGGRVQGRIRNAGGDSFKPPHGFDIQLPGQIIQFDKSFIFPDK